ncbi:MAG: hypothetical protein CME46_05655, partial [Halieaceae bacterium]|nr:hypothetical protein [Halieaceae bacterium]
MSADPDVSVVESLPSTPPWLDHLLQQWEASGAQRGHAFLLVSEDPEEAALFSRRLAVAQLCHDRQPDGPCGRCRSCHAFLRGTHGDLMDVQRQEGKTAIGIEQIRQAAQFLQQTALYGEIKVMMIRDADQLTLAAANSLLKTLEEPAGNALLLLSTSAVWRLPATVRSRCQQLRLPSARRSEGIDWLAQQLGTDAEQAGRLLNLTGGRPVSACTMGESQEAEQQLALISSFAELHRQTTGSPGPWSTVGLDVLLKRLLGWTEDSVRGLDNDRFVSEAKSWLLLHRCVAEV